MKGSTRAILPLTALLAAVPLALGAAPAPPDFSSGGESYYVYSPDSGLTTPSSAVPDLIPEEPAPGSSSGEASPQLIDDPVAWSSCFGPTLNADYPLASYDGVPQASGTIYLQCGPNDTKTYGWHHIQDEHQAEWQSRADQIPAAPAWDDVMAIANYHVLAENQGRYTVEYSGKRCYTGTVQIYDGEGNFLYEFEPSVVVSMTNNRVITSYPTTLTDCARSAPWA